MTKEQKVRAYGMLLDGKTYQEVADVLGVSRQYVHQEFGDKVGVRKRALTHLHNQIYPNIVTYMKDNGLSRSVFAQKCGISYDGLLTILRGDREPRKKEIDKILAVTGMTYEVAFKEKGGKSHG